MTKLSNKHLVIIALLLSLLTVILGYYYLKGVTTDKGVQEGVAVIVAKVDITPKTKITSEMVSEIKVPPEYVQPGAVQALDKVVGIVAIEAITSGEQISERRLLRDSKVVGFTGTIPRDKRAMTIAVNEVTGVAGFVKSGDYADIIVTFDATMVGDHVSQVIMQNILVLAVNRESERGVTDSNAKENAKEINKTATVTMAVTPDEAAALSLAEEKGRIRLALRPYLPLNTMVLVQPITPKELVGEHLAPTKNVQPPAQPPVQPPRQVPSTNENNHQEMKPKSLPNNYGVQVIRGTKLDSGL